MVGSVLGERMLCVSETHARILFQTRMHSNSDTERVTRVRVWDDDEIGFTSMDAIFKLEGQYTDVKSGCVTSVGPCLNPHSLSFKKILGLLSL